MNWVGARGEGFSLASSADEVSSLLTRDQVSPSSNWELCCDLELPEKYFKCMNDKVENTVYLR